MHRSLHAVALCSLLACQPVPVVPAHGELSASPESLELARVAVGERSEAELVLSNRGAAPIVFASMAIEGGSATSFGLLTVQPLALEAGGSVRLGVQYFPSMAGQHLARLVIRSDASNAPLLEVALRGEAFSPTRCGAPSLEGSPCADGDPCTEGDRCQAGVCRGEPRRCLTPPAALCASSARVSSWESPGTCQAGSCVYREVESSCVNGCSDGVCLPDPCAGVQCSSPPPCMGGGRCVSGACQYEPTPGAACDDGDACTTNDVCNSAGRCGGQGCEAPVHGRVSCEPGGCVASCETGYFSCALGCCAEGPFAPGYQETCAQRADGGLACFGVDAVSLGDGVTTQSTTPVPVTLSGVFVDLSLGSSHACALRADGAVYCWGFNGLGSLGDGTRMNRPLPVQVVGLDAGVRALGHGAVPNHQCVVFSDDRLACWGNNASGQLGDGTFTTRDVPVVVSPRSIAEVVLGQSHSCAVTRGGALWCWGANEKGQLGLGFASDAGTSTPGLVLDGGVASAAAGLAHTCARMTTGAVKCWGDNTWGQLGTGASMPTESAVPLDARLDAGVVELSASWGHTCGLTALGTVKCWGLNQRGELGRGTTSFSEPGAGNVLGLGLSTHLASGLDHTCARLVNGALRCWGRNDFGQVGNGSPSLGEPSPVEVQGL